MTRKGPWGAEESWELSETQFAAKDIGRNGSGREGSIQNGSANGSAGRRTGQSKMVSMETARMGECKMGHQSRMGGVKMGQSPECQIKMVNIGMGMA